MSDLYFNEESDCSWENTCDNKLFHFTIFQPFQFKLEQKTTCGNESPEKETKHTHASAADLFLIRIGRSYHRRCSVKNGILRNFAKFTGIPCARA